MNDNKWGEKNPLIFDNFFKFKIEKTKHDKGAMFLKITQKGLWALIPKPLNFSLEKIFPPFRETANVQLD